MQRGYCLQDNHNLENRLSFHHNATCGFWVCLIFEGKSWWEDVQVPFRETHNYIPHCNKVLPHTSLLHKSSILISFLHSWVDLVGNQLRIYIITITITIWHVWSEIWSYRMTALKMEILKNAKINAPPPPFIMT